MAKWHLWRDASHSPWFNMAADELLLHSMRNDPTPILRIYTWDRPSVSIGYAQTWGIVPAGYAAVRRLTGGGVVFHDVDLTYTLVFPDGHPLAEHSREESYQLIHGALAGIMGDAALLDETVQPESHAVMQCFVTPSKFDVMTPDGTKSAGAAQRRTKDGILHQGSVLLSVADGDPVKLSQLIENAFVTAFDVEYVSWRPTDGFLEKSALLGEAKYRSEGWSQKRRYQESFDL